MFDQTFFSRSFDLMNPLRKASLGLAVLVSLFSVQLSANPPCVTNEVIQLDLVAAPSGTLISTLSNNYVINKASISGSFNISAITCNGTVGSVVFNVNGSNVRTETAAPYALSGDKNGSFKS